MTGDEVEALLLEVSTGKPSGLPNTGEFERVRQQLRDEVKAIVSAGASVDVPAEIPEADLTVNVPDEEEES